MLALGGLIVFAGYVVGSYGRVLIKGWNITFGQWVNPLNPYQWPPGGPPPIPPTQIFPGGTGTGSGTAAGAADQTGTYQQSVASEGGNPIQQTGGTVAGGHGR